MPLACPSLAFVHIPRTGGRSVLVSLGAVREHCSAAVLRSRYPGADLFSIVRHPCDHALSWWSNLNPGAAPDEFREWVRTQYANVSVRVGRGRHLNPLAQAEWVDERTTLFRFPDVDGAIQWAGQRCGIQPIFRRLGVTRERPDWRDWFDPETEAIVRESRVIEMGWFA